MGRKVLAVIVGWIAAVAVFMLGQMLATLFVPMAITPGKSDGEQMRAIIESMPTAGFVMLISVYALGSFAGGFVATNIGRRFSSGPSLALIVAALLFVGGLLNFFVLLPFHPAWVTALSLAVYFPFSLLGYKIAGGTVAKGEKETAAA